MEMGRRVGLHLLVLCREGCAGATLYHLWSPADLARVPEQCACQHKPQPRRSNGSLSPQSMQPRLDFLLRPVGFQSVEMSSQHERLEGHLNRNEYFVVTMRAVLAPIADGRLWQLASLRLRLRSRLRRPPPSLSSLWKNERRSSIGIG